MMVMVAGAQSRKGDLLKISLGKKYRHFCMRDQQCAFGSQQHGRFSRIVLHGKQGPYLFWAIKFSIKPFYLQFRGFGQFISWKHPGDVVALWPCVASSFWRILPRLLNPCMYRSRGLKVKAFPHRIKNMAADITGPSCAEILPSPPFGGMVDFR